MKYSLVVPVYNNSKGISDLYEAISTFFKTESLEFIFVDDFSQDTSWEELKKIRAKDNRCKIIRLSKNFGQHAATLCGFAESKGEFVLTLDDDLEVLPIEFQKLIDKQKVTNAKVVYGEYQQKEAAFKRKLRYYSPSIFRKFSVENNAPYFRVMMKRYFYHYKPSLRWERTMHVASLRKDRRKTSRIPRKLQMSSYNSNVDNKESLQNQNNLRTLSASEKTVSPNLSSQELKDNQSLVLEVLK
jgi:glycosyltransferase involved in cell wall biosynthesis